MGFRAAARFLGAALPFPLAVAAGDAWEQQRLDGQLASAIARAAEGERQGEGGDEGEVGAPSAAALCRGWLDASVSTGSCSGPAGRGHLFILAGGPAAAANVRAAHGAALHVVVPPRGEEGDGRDEGGLAAALRSAASELVAREEALEGGKGALGAAAATAHSLRETIAPRPPAYWMESVAWALEHAALPTPQIAPTPLEPEDVAPPPDEFPGERGQITTDAAAASDTAPRVPARGEGRGGVEPAPAGGPPPPGQVVVVLHGIEVSRESDAAPAGAWIRRVVEGGCDVVVAGGLRPGRASDAAWLRDVIAAYGAGGAAHVPPPEAPLLPPAAAAAVGGTGWAAGGAVAEQAVASIEALLGKEAAAINEAVGSGGSGSAPPPPPQSPPRRGWRSWLRRGEPEATAAGTEAVGSEAGAVVAADPPPARRGWRSWLRRGQSPDMAPLPPAVDGPRAPHPPPLRHVVPMPRAGEGHGTVGGPGEAPAPAGQPALGGGGGWGWLTPWRRRRETAPGLEAGGGAQPPRPPPTPAGPRGRRDPREWRVNEKGDWVASPLEPPGDPSPWGADSKEHYYDDAEAAGAAGAAEGGGDYPEAQQHAQHAQQGCGVYLVWPAAEDYDPDLIHAEGVLLRVLRAGFVRVEEGEVEGGGGGGGAGRGDSEGGAAAEPIVDPWGPDSKEHYYDDAEAAGAVEGGGGDAPAAGLGGWLEEGGRGGGWEPYQAWGALLTLTGAAEPVTLHADVSAAAGGRDVSEAVFTALQMGPCGGDRCAVQGLMDAGVVRRDLKLVPAGPGPHVACASRLLEEAAAEDAAALDAASRGEASPAVVLGADLGRVLTAPTGILGAFKSIQGAAASSRAGRVAGLVASLEAGAELQRLEGDAEHHRERGAVLEEDWGRLAELARALRGREVSEEQGLIVQLELRRMQRELELRQTLWERRGRELESQAQAARDVAMAGGRGGMGESE